MMLGFCINCQVVYRNRRLRCWVFVNNCHQSLVECWSGRQSRWWSGMMDCVHKCEFKFETDMIDIGFIWNLSSRCWIPITMGRVLPIFSISHSIPYIIFLFHSVLTPSSYPTISFCEATTKEALCSIKMF